MPEWAEAVYATDWETRSDLARKNDCAIEATCFLHQLLFPGGTFLAPQFSGINQRGEKKQNLHLNINKCSFYQ